MKKTLLVLALSLTLMVVLSFAISAESVTVVDDGSTDITLGECVIEGLGKDIPEASRGFTYVLDTETKTAKITNWANKADSTLGATYCLPSTVIYEGTTYTVTAFSAVGFQNAGNTILVTVAIPDTVTTLPTNAFDDCRALRYVYIGSGVETIGKYAFRNAGFTANSSTDESGEEIGNIREFIWKTTKVTTLSEGSFYHMDFNSNSVIEFPFDKITTYEAYCLAYNMHAFQSTHNFNKQLYIDEFDIRNATVASTAFEHSALAKTIIVRADQVNVLSPQKLRGNGTAQPDKYCNFIIFGGETADEAITLTVGIWTANAWFWGSPQPHYNIVFNGYVNAYDGTDVLENQNGYGKDVVDYFFESEEAFSHYLSTLDETTNRTTTYTRYAKNTMGYFNVCTTVDGTHTFKAYNLKYTPAVEGVDDDPETEADETVLAVEEKIEIVEYTQTSFSFGYPENITILDDDCTASTLCWCCDTIFEKGKEHSLSVTISYANGYLKTGVKAVTCQNEGCEYCESPQSVSALFVCKGFSFSGDSMLQGFAVNTNALEEYKLNIGDTNLEYGLLAASYEKVGDTLYNESGFVAGVASVSFYGKGYDIFEMKIKGIADAYKTKSIYLCAYIIVNGKITYINAGSESENATSASYNELNPSQDGE